MSKTITLDMNSSPVQYLCNKDKRLAKVIRMVGPITYKTHYENPYAFLVHEIIEQMLSVKAGAMIYSRLVDLCNGKIDPSVVNKIPDDQLKSIGTSINKVRCIRTLTDSIINNILSLGDLPALSDTEVIDELTKIKGIGMWTAKMYLLFVLNRDDVLPFEDVAFLQSYKWMYKTEDISRVSVEKKCRKWKPYTSIAARYLYKALDSGLTKNEFHLYKEG